eukprot:3119744-Pyramimonas_sp.AAC.1
MMAMAQCHEVKVVPIAFRRFEWQCHQHGSARASLVPAVRASSADGGGKRGTLVIAAEAAFRRLDATSIRKIAAAKGYAISNSGA